ncbi:MAG: glycosyltransferase, partial [Pyramidobacter sp.]|nr:glycosyltransferase [Pyramidobacter sp.]
MQAAENDLAGTRSQAAALQHELDFTQQRLGEEQGSSAKLQSELVDTKGKAVALQNELDSTKQRLGEEQGASAKLQSELADTKGRAAALQNELESTRLQLGKEQSACAKLQKDLADTGGLATALQSELKFTQQRLDTEKSVCRKLQNQNSILERNLDSTMKKAQSLQLELGSAQRQLADEQNAHHKLQEQHAVLEGDLADERDHTEVLQHDLEEVRLALEAARHELEQTRTQLAASENNVSALNTELTTLRGTTDAAISDLNRRLGEEHAKAEYLWHEYNQIRSAWSLRIFGRFHLRRKFRNLGLLAGRLLFNGGKGFVDHLPIRYETRIRIKNAIYGNFGFCFRSAIRYNEWRSYEQRKKSVCSVLTPGAGLEVPADLPLTSIIIPVYNNLKYTLGCLHAIYAIRSKAPFEVIVVDDCSTEDYSVLRREYPKVKVLRNERNSGFLRTVNRGAREAAGEYVLILNNDTEVLPGWLDELATALYHHAEAGMIGSQLIHMRTGTLQESGNLICKNG